MNRKLTALLSLIMVAAFAMMSISSHAAVMFDASSGTGFVGKGDVQLAFGWNNSQLQKNAAGVTFTYNATDTYDVGCYWETETGNGNIIVHDLTIPRHTSINAAIAYDARTRNQITGFNLNGFGAMVTEGSVPVVGDSCPGNNPGTVTDVTKTSSSEGGLFVNYGGSSVALPNTPVLVQ